MEPDRAVADLESFLAERGKPLLRTAILLTGSREAGEDLLQAALERLLGHWRTIEGSPEGYLRRTLYHLATDGWRRQRAWRKQLTLLQSTADLAAEDRTAQVDLRDALVRLLVQLPPRQRAVIVARLRPRDHSGPGTGQHRGDLPRQDLVALRAPRAPGPGRSATAKLLRL